MVLFFLGSFRTDTQAEIDLVCQIAKECGASDALPCNHWAQGGRGCSELAQAVKEAASKPSDYQFLYNTEVSADNVVEILFSYCSTIGGIPVPSVSVLDK